MSVEGPGVGAGPPAGRDRAGDQGRRAAAAGRGRHRRAVAARRGALGRHDRAVALPLLRQPGRAAHRAGHRRAPPAGRRRAGGRRRDPGPAAAGAAGWPPPAPTGTGRWPTARRSCCSTAPRCPGSRPRPTPTPARPRSGWPRRSSTWCTTAGPPSSWPRYRCPTTGRSTCRTRRSRCRSGRWPTSSSCARPMHGLVMLELLDHLHPFNAVAGDLYAAAMHRMSDTLDALQHRAGRA